MDSGYALYNSLALDSNNTPWVAWAEQVPASNQVPAKNTIYVAKEGMSAGQAKFIKVGGEVGVGLQMSIDVGSNSQPYVAYVASAPTGLFVSRYDGNGWSKLGGSLQVNTGSNALNTPIVRLDSNNRPQVSWVENDTTIYFKYWTGTAWANYGSTAKVADITPAMVVFAFDLDTSNVPYIAYFTTASGTQSVVVKKWSGSSWVQVGNSLNSGNSMSTSSAMNLKMVLDSSQLPVVAWSEFGGSSTNTYVSHYKAGQWVAYPAALPHRLQALALQANGTPYLATSEAHRWDGTGWQLITPRVFDPFAATPSIAYYSFINSGTPRGTDFITAYVVRPIGSTGLENALYVRHFFE